MKQQLAFFLCLCMLCGGVLSVPLWAKPEEPVQESMQEPVEEQMSFDAGLNLRVQQGDQVAQMTLSEYLAGVVSAEMPHSFPMEALKAQAVAARTFTLRCSSTGKHEAADICTDSTCCQAWSGELNPYAQQAVAQTDGIVLTYEEELIEATYFSCSGGRTEAAVAVWGSDVPYLQAVDSPGEEDAPRFSESLELTTQAFAARLQTVRPKLELQGSATQWIGRIKYTVGNGVETVEIGEEQFSGTELRKLLGLRSTNIRFCVTEDGITIHTLGYGHRVGLSQYGAKAMAEQNCDFAKILSHYYQNAEIKRLFHDTEEA